MHSWVTSVVTALTSEMPGRLFFWAFCIVSVPLLAEFSYLTDPLSIAERMQQASPRPRGRPGFPAIAGVHQLRLYASIKNAG
jgi:hypothetical protein